MPVELLILIPLGVLIGAMGGAIAGICYLAWLDDHVPDWYMRPWWRCWRPHA